MFFLLHGLVLATAAWAMLALLFLRSRVKKYGRRVLYASAAGSSTSGALFAFTKAMLPWAKESIRENLSSYVFGIAFHIGIFTALSFLLLEILDHRNYLPYQVYFTVALLLVCGVLSGLLLFIKRVSNPILRGISCFDDYISNILSTLFVAFALFVSLSSCQKCSLSDWLLQAWLLSAIALFVYVPLGKIRHCVFFFSTRYHLGAFFGRRGCMPPANERGG